MASFNSNDSYKAQLNVWHCDLAITADVLFHLLDNLDDVEEWQSSLASLLKDKFSHLVESCPFPSSTPEEIAA